jgi:hypothetical protein
LNCNQQRLTADSIETGVKTVGLNIGYHKWTSKMRSSSGLYCRLNYLAAQIKIIDLVMMKNITPTNHR